MKSKIIKRCLFTFAIVFAIATETYSQSQDLNLINLQTVLLNSEKVNFYEGELTLNTNVVLKGKISINHQKDKQYETLLETDKGYVYIDNRDIHTIILNSTLENRPTKTHFFKLNDNNKFYRQLYKKNESNAVYDTLEQPFDNKTIDDVYVLENNQLVSLDDFWTSGPKKDLINYINNRDQSKYKRKDFKTLHELFALL